WPGEQELDRETFRSQTADCRGRCEHALISQHARDECHSDGIAAGLGERQKTANVDPRSPDQGDSRGVEPNLGQSGTVLRVLPYDPTPGPACHETERQAEL